MVSDDAKAVRYLTDHAHQVERVSDPRAWHAVLRRINRGRRGRAQGSPVTSNWTTAWVDTVSDERPGWRERAAHLDGQTVFAVDYQTCRRCRFGWVEQPYTDPQYQRCGLATAGLAAVRTEHPNLSWHTLGGHLSDSQAFWTAVGADVPGSYAQRHLCPHIRPG